MTLVTYFLLSHDKMLMLLQVVYEAQCSPCDASHFWLATPAGRIGMCRTTAAQSVGKPTVVNSAMW